MLSLHQLCGLCIRLPAARRTNLLGRTFKQQAVPDALYRHLRHSNAPALLSAHTRPALLDVHTILHLHPCGRHCRHGRSRCLPRSRQAPRRDSVNLLLHCFCLYHKPCLCLCRTLHVLHSHLRDEASSGCHEGSVYASGFRNDLLCGLRCGHVRLPWAYCCVSCLQQSTTEMGQSSVWYCDSKFSHCRESLRAYGGEVVLHPLLPGQQASP